MKRTAPGDPPMNKTESIPIRFQYLFPQTIPDQHPDQKTIITCGPCTGMAAFRSKLAYSVCWLFAILPDSANKTLMLRPNARLEIQDSRGFLQEKTVLRHSPNLQKPCTRKRELSKRAKPMTHARPDGHFKQERLLNSMPLRELLPWGWGWLALKT